MIDTKATVSMAKLSILGTTKGAYLTICNYLFKTATGETAQTHTEVDVKLELEQFNITHQMVVADIVDDVTLSVDIIKKYGFVQDIKNRVLRLGNKKILLHSIYASFV